MCCQYGSRITSIMGTVYPVGSLYFGTQSTCPLASIISGSTWKKVGSSVITSINSTAPVVGNGQSLGLSDFQSTTKYGGIRNGNGQQLVPTSSYGVSLPSTSADNYGFTTNSVLGVTTDPSKSGIVANLSSATLTVNIWKRTA